MMTSALIVGVCTALVVVALLHRGTGTRTLLLRCIAVTLLASALLRELEEVDGGQPRADLLKRLIFLIALAAVVVLVLTFRRPAASTRTILRVWAGAATIGLIECLLLALMPAAPSDVLLYAHADTSMAAFLYYAIYEATIAATAIFCALGSAAVLVRTRQPLIARLSLVLLTLAAVTTLCYVGAGWLSVGQEGSSPELLILRRHLFLATITLLLAGMTASGLHRLMVAVRAAVTMSVATDVVEPLWREVVALHPGVRLAVDQPTRRERLLRLVVETNDALHRMRRGSQSPPDPLDPQAMAQLVIDVLGEDAVPGPLRRRTRLLVRLGALRADDALVSSIRDLYDMRTVFAVRDQRRARSTPIVPALPPETTGWIRTAP
ncbi:hypothetical protein NSA19_04875 [Actinomyces bowdenii]|uniref:DUF6545 domain-containing protein n=1 Tax=Actinomyces bowdenii TaxID=131109 RepID=UPI00214ABCCF|nr:DUF6545 domain-containing protein [Actinomyces bowdenii]MCR2052188.1 hypothetical protein [Actinomyces bowdenii]